MCAASKHDRKNCMDRATEHTLYPLLLSAAAAESFFIYLFVSAVLVLAGGRAS
jgi:hypothetical protein